MLRWTPERAVITNTFYGPWRIRSEDDWPTQSFVIAGSDNADGRYDTRSLGRGFEISVQGARWTVRLESLDAEGNWVPGEAVPESRDGGAARRTRFIPKDGLIVELATGSVPWIHTMSDLLFLGVHLVCTCLDPDTQHPNPTPNPFDFTIPHGPSGERG